MTTATATTSGIEDLGEEWDALADRVGAPLFARPGWYSAWRAAFGAGEPEFVTVRRDGRLAGIGALQRRGSVLESMTNWHTVEFDLLAEDETSVQNLAAAIFETSPRRASFAFMTEGESCVGVLAAAASHARYRTITRTLESSPYVRIEGTWDAYQAGRDRHLVTETRRRRRRLEEQGSVTFELTDGRERLDSLLAEGFPIEASGWKGEQGTAILSRPETRRFYTDLARWAATRGALRLAFLRLNDRPLAFQFLIEDAQTLYFLKGGYETAFRKLAPGTLLIEEVLSYAFANRLRTFEFLGFPDPFKLDWTDLLRNRQLLQAFSPTPSGIMDWGAWAYGRPLAKRAVRALRKRA